MRFLNPDILWNLLWLLPLAILVFFISEYKTLAVLRRFLGKNAENPDYVSVSRGKRFLRFGLLLLSFIFLVIAWARPSWGVQIQEIHGQGRDLLFVFDTSKSMLAKDVQPSRMAHAKWLTKELVKLNPGDRFGLIAFAGRAFLECPLTADKTSFIQSVDELSVDSIPVGGTNIQSALETALLAFKAAETPHRAVILVTDGDELEGDSGKAVDEIIARKIPLFIAGIGDPSQPSIIQVPDGKGGFKTLKDSAGNVVTSPLNEISLGALAKKTGGIYVRSTAGDPRIGALEKRIRALAPQEYESIKTTKPIDRFVYPIALALLLLLIRFAISERTIRKTSAVLLLLLCSATVSIQAQTPQGPLKTALPQENASASVQEDKTQQLPSDPVSLFNQGVEQQASGDFQNAVKSYETALASGVDNIEIRGKASQNLGVISHSKARSEITNTWKSLQGQQLDAASKNIESAIKDLDQTEIMYRETLRDSDDHAVIAKNQSILLADRKKAEELKKKIEELKKAQQQAQQKTQQAKDQQKKENQKQEQSGKDQQKQEQSGKDQQQKQEQSGKDQQQKQEQSGKDQQQKQEQSGKDQQQKQEQSGKDQQQKQEQSSAQQKTDEAEKAAQDLKEKAKELGQQKLEKSAEQAKKELDKAREEQKKGNGKAAEDHLKKALDELGANQQKQNEKDQKDQKDKSGQDQQKQEQKDESGKDQQKQEQKDESGKDQQKQEQSQEEGEIDKNQAASILEDMAKDEKNLRDAIKARQKQHYRNTVPAKDW